MIQNLDPTLTFFLGLFASFVISLIANYFFSSHFRQQINRIQNWYAQRSSESLRKRIQKLEAELSETSRYMENPQSLTLYFWKSLLEGVKFLSFGGVSWVFISIFNDPFMLKLFLPLVVFLTSYRLQSISTKAIRIISRVQSYSNYKSEVKSQIDELQGKITGHLDVAGNWKGNFCTYQEGVLSIEQNGAKVSATLTTSCHYDDGSDEIIHEYLTGNIKGIKVTLKGEKVFTAGQETMPNYFVDNFVLLLSSNGLKLEGAVSDQSGTYDATFLKQ